MTRSMRVALIVPVFPQTSETFLVRKAAGLVRDGAEVTIHCRRSPRSAWASLEPEQRALLEPRVRLRPPTRPRWRAAAWWPWRVALCLLLRPAATVRYLVRGLTAAGPKALWRLPHDASLVRERPEIVHFEFGALAAERPELAWLLEARLVVSFRGYDLNSVGLEQPAFYASVWRSADALHFLGRHLLTRARQRGLPASARYRLIPPAVDPADFPAPPSDRSAASAAADRLRLVSVGRLSWQKGYEYALAAVALLGRRGLPVRYRIVGDGELWEAIAFLRHELGLEEEVELLGARTPTEVRDELVSADVLLHGAVSEGFSNAILEAQACGLAVVCTDAGGLPENVVDGETGLIVPRRDPAALADAVERLHGSSELRRRLGEAGRERVRRHFALPDQIRAFRELYEEVLADGPVRRPASGRPEGRAG